ncbi:hypothetical protein C8Q76DRAFT_730562 [Earliella scabrosa]|nr:hypothetical protein C8Q76DRAFT_730562 [Earliella scabrosa]
MPRKIAFSAKQRREQLRLKRAVKRGDISPPPPIKRKTRKQPTGTRHSTARAAAATSTRRLESSFLKLPQAFLEKTRVLASTLPLPRPIPPELAILSDVDKPAPGADSSPLNQLTCPSRPEWRYDMSKKEVEANEEGLFKKWLAQTDASLNAWCSTDDVVQHAPDAPAHIQPAASDKPESMPHAPTAFVRNLEVWRQLWRVTEISQILLILLDSRCPTLHLPPALSAYSSSVSNASRLRIILVLTKVDIAGPDRAAAWTKYLSALHPGTRVVQVESYTEKHPGGEGSSKKRMFEPHLPSAFRKTLVDALRETHAELLEPPSAVKNKPERLATWKPRIKSEVDWDAVLKAHGGQVGTAVGGPKHKTSAAPDDAPAEEHPGDDDSEPEVLTIGLIGQPNVGKSSLLNALFGTTKVRASRTPGKTKHFQTLFWTSEVRLVDCPGLVIPNYVPMETQVLSGILPISRVSAIPLCVHHAARLLPLEKVLGLTHPSVASAPVEDKRTWRPGMHPRDAQRQPAWTAMDILTAYANKKGWITARTGWPDVNRAGNAILRALAEGRIRWAFWPPGTDVQTIIAHQGGGEGPDGAGAGAGAGAGNGIWIAHGQDESDAESEDDRHARPHGSGSEDDDDDDDHDGQAAVSDSEEEEEEGDEEDWASSRSEDESGERDNGMNERGAAAKSAGGGNAVPRAKIGGTASRFGALALEDQGDEEDED